MSNQKPRLPNQVNPEPDYAQFNKRVSITFSDWFAKEKNRSGMSTRGLMDALAVAYCKWLGHPATKWDEP